MRTLEGRGQDASGEPDRRVGFQILGPQAHAPPRPGGQAQAGAAAQIGFDTEQPGPRMALPRREKDVGFDHMAMADETGDRLGCRLAVQGRRRADLKNAPALHHRDPVRHGHGLGLIMGDIDHGRARASVERAEGFLHRGA